MNTSGEVNEVIKVTTSISKRSIVDTATSRSSKSKGKVSQIRKSPECSVEKMTRNTIAESSSTLASEGRSDRSKTLVSSELQSTPETIGKLKVGLNPFTSIPHLSINKIMQINIVIAKKSAPPTSETTDLPSVRLTRSAARKLNNLTSEVFQKAENEASK
ncbi:unnamed protein product [Rodentolepis nana]|uniref:Uncharacterized protein n=1 Tax=Rodentolepis nana TaxID=102285 RepID=A0A0R3TF32_RODNA|nr:unnamed protein product [Rodentolepis nana]